ncbi:MAG: glycerol-3-phosphate 1-O-acyltransferase PlsY [Lachnospiraceae bacterium]|nr:glycerol-3-phosphate 1-O-acyltransferase PlsY [Lachnospiraceae bacterium]
MAVGYRLLSFVLGYAIGNISLGYIMGRIRKVDLKTHGSGNIGATNSLRVLGPAAGLITLVFDVLKAVIAAALAFLTFSNISGATDFASIRLFMAYAGFGAVIGHIFPVYLRFIGGKGIATALGLMMVAFPKTILICVLVFLIAVLLTRYVSLGSVLAALALIAQSIIFALFIPSFLPYQGTEVYEAMAFGVITGLIALIKHRSNIKRLITHTENKLSFHSKPSLGEEKKEEK